MLNNEPSRGHQPFSSPRFTVKCHANCHSLSQQSVEKLLGVTRDSTLYRSFSEIRTFSADSAGVLTRLHGGNWSHVTLTWYSKHALSVQCLIESSSYQAFFTRHTIHQYGVLCGAYVYEFLLRCLNAIWLCPHGPPCRLKFFKYLFFRQFKFLSLMFWGCWHVEKWLNLSLVP